MIFVYQRRHKEGTASELAEPPTTHAAINCSGMGTWVHCCRHLLADDVPVPKLPGPRCRLHLAAAVNTVQKDQQSNGPRCNNAPQGKTATDSYCPAHTYDTTNIIHQPHHPRYSANATHKKVHCTHHLSCLAIRFKIVGTSSTRAFLLPRCCSFLAAQPRIISSQASDKQPPAQMHSSNTCRQLTSKEGHISTTPTRCVALPPCCLPLSCHFGRQTLPQALPNTHITHIVLRISSASDSRPQAGGHATHSAYCCCVSVPHHAHASCAWLAACRHTCSDGSSKLTSCVSMSAVLSSWWVATHVCCNDLQLRPTCLHSAACECPTALQKMSVHSTLNTVCMLQCSAHVRD
jgi:hypothetical protein